MSLLKPDLELPMPMSNVEQKIGGVCQNGQLQNRPSDWFMMVHVQSENPQRKGVQQFKKDTQSKRSGEASPALMEYDHHLCCSTTVVPGQIPICDARTFIFVIKITIFAG